MVRFQDEKQEAKLKELRLKEEEDITMLLAEKYGIPYINLVGIPINTDALRLVNEDIAREAQIAGFKLIGKKLYVAVAKPKEEKTVAVINDLKRQGYRVIPYIVSKVNLEKIYERYEEVSRATETQAGILDVSTEKLQEFADQVHNLDDLKRLIEEVVTEGGRQSTSRVFEIVLAGAVSINASDVHLEPQEKDIRLRYRLDGVLQDIMMLRADVYKLLLARVKLVSGVKLNIKTQAQDGRFTINVGPKNPDIEVRTSIIPGSYGESVVLRVLDPSKISIKFHDLGIEDYLLKIIEREIKKPTGAILNTGPTGSGKSTSLYAFLNRIYGPGVKIITVEDPVEYHLKGIVQTQVDKKRGYDFANGLRSILRQDPDVIMIGEVRDSDTAKIAINSALTGHLVFSTLHTNNAAGAIPRLIDLGVSPKVLSSAVNVCLAQRLIRKLCPNCKKKMKQSPDEQKLIDFVAARIQKKGRDVENSGIIFKPVGCENCFGTGYQGRIGIYEGVLVEAEMDDIIQSRPSDTEIKKAGEYQKILDLREDGMMKVIDGNSALEELDRIVDLYEGLDISPVVLGESVRGSLVEDVNAKQTNETELEPASKVVNEELAKEEEAESEAVPEVLNELGEDTLAGPAETTTDELGDTPEKPAV